MSNMVMLILLIVLLVVLAILAVAYRAISKKNDKVSEDAIFLTSKKVHYDVWINLYSTLDSVKLTKNLVNRMYKQYEILDPGNEKLVKEKAVKTTCLLLCMDVVVFFVVLLCKPSVFSITCALWFIYNATNMIVDNALVKQEADLDQSFSTFISEVRHNYFKHGMVDEAIYETFDRLNRRMQSHAILIYKTLTARDLDEALRKYSVCAPNAYMKQFVSICATTIKYGDKTVDNQSLFLKDIKDLKQTMDSARLQKAGVKAKFSCLTMIVMIPIFTMDLIKNWGISVVGSLQKFYNGKWGIILVFGAFAVSLIDMIIVNHLKHGKQVDKADHPMLEFLLEQRPIARFVHNFEEHYYTKTYKLRLLLKRTGSSHTSSTLLLYRIIYGAVAFVCTIVLLISINIVQVNMTINDVREVADKGSGTSDYANVAMMALTDHYMRMYMHYDLVDLYNNEVFPGGNISKLDDNANATLQLWLVDKISTSQVDISDEDLIRIIRSYNTNHSADTSLMTVCYGDTDNPVEIDGADELTLRKIQRDFLRIKELVCAENALKEPYIYEIIAERVIAHVRDYQNASIKWWFFALAVAMAVLFYNVPIIVLKVNEKELQNFMEDEVIQFQSIIMILMHIDQITVETILEEMNKFAFCFQESIQKCINHIASGEEKALQQLMIDEPFEPFVRLVENLIACDRIGVKQAFNEIDIERQNYIERRKQEGEIKLNNKAATAQFLAYLPLYFVIILYMIVPFIIEAMTTLTDSMSGI